MPDTFPPPGEPAQPPRPAQGGSPPYGAPPARSYPQQELLPQEVKGGRSRLRLIAGLVVALALVGGGVAAWLLLRDNGESTRAQYCAAIRDVIPDGDMTTALRGLQQNPVAKVRRIESLAPSSVAGDWKTLTDLLESVQKSGTPDMSLLLGALGPAKSVIQDSNEHCGTKIKVPSLP